jgi:hypothetical protein
MYASQRMLQLRAKITSRQLISTILKASTHEFLLERSISRIRYTFESNLHVTQFNLKTGRVMTYHN